MESFLRKMGRATARLLPKTSYPVIRGPLAGAKFILGSFAGEGGGASVFLNLSEREQIAAFARTVKRGDTVFDIGANVGYYTILASRLVAPDGMVAAFEPVPSNLAFLEEHLKLNDVANVRVCPLACSDASGTDTFHTGRNSAMGGFYVTEGDELTVRRITIDEFVDQERLVPDVIKLDVEGAELDVLNGGLRTIERHRPTIFLSTHSASLRVDCIPLLEGQGYDITPLIASDDPHEFLASHPQRKEK